jgi:hypothetical protein
MGYFTQTVTVDASSQDVSSPETFIKSCYLHKQYISQQLPSPALDEKYR